MPETDILEILLDEENASPITLYAEDGTENTLEQVAVIPYEGEIYAVMHPLNEEFADDEAIVLKVMSNNGDHALIVESDEDICTEVFERYLALLDEE